MAGILVRSTFAPSQLAVVDGDGSSTYGDILAKAADVADSLAAHGAHADPAPSEGAQGLARDLQGRRVAIMAPPGVEYVSASFGVWLAGGVCVPLALMHPPPELEYVLTDSGAVAVLCSQTYQERMKPVADKVGIPIVGLQPGCGTATAAAALRASLLAETAAGRDPASGALVIYTSGTTGRPKGALHSHGGLLALVRSLHGAWQWTAADRIYHCLPLHHIHGIVNAWLCAMYAGAAVEFVPKFSTSGWWQRVCSTDLPPISVFMGVPTMFHYLLSGYEGMPEEAKADARRGASRIRLTISGSAACPVTVHESWQALSGCKLLERYGMTEIGMALSNPYSPASERVPGWVGKPLPGVEVKIVPFEKSTDGSEIEEAASGEEQGELRVRGPGIFREYIGRPEATSESFDEAGFFRTGDAVAFCPRRQIYRILGRSSVDIIKSGGYKLSALEIESELLHHPGIGECAVLGVDHASLGQEVAVVVAAKAGGAAPPELSELKCWAGERMAPYKIPKSMVVLDAIPRNAMGKVNKVDLKRVFAK
eukprot:TRINITY_DN9126_c0_g1_i1.p1 TRINITY_DN9126_c0_g1~~TRINITY_DN9126_c0_g1_i1.p1  ORF type:complete len:558 (+),score=131.67 TRINITY_DN9126_c0_g1_i1:59-1675(+)